MLIGVIADTHGFADPQLSEIFRDAEQIVHAGDIGSLEVLCALRRIAPVFAVRGNIDRDPELLKLPERVDVSIGGMQVQIVHRVQDAAPKGWTRVVISGHSHRPVAEWHGPILYLNPGAAGRQGFHRERTVCLLDLNERPSSTLIVLGPKARIKV